MKESNGENSSTKTKEKEQKESVVFAYPRHTEQKLYFYTENKRKRLDQYEKSSVQNGYVEQGGMDKVAVTGARDDRNNTKKI